jgi:hypothetical protein
MPGKNHCEQSGDQRAERGLGLKRRRLSIRNAQRPGIAAGGSGWPLVALYYLLPLDHIRNVPVTLAVGLVILLAVTVVQLRIIVKARYPAVRAIEALAATVPLFLLLFASAYIAMTSANPANFSTHPLTRTDALYFTVTVFTTVGFGDITAASQSARLVVTVQMLLDLVALGLVVRALVGAVQLARQQAPPAAAPAAAPAVGPGLPPGQAPRQGDDVQ